MVFLFCAYVKLVNSLMDFEYGLGLKISMFDERSEEFVFGRHKTAQVRIATIEQRAGLSFGPLTALDPFDGDEEGVETELTDPAQIRFLKRRRA
jgi:hypothetical protein